MKLIIACDHGGYLLKKEILNALKESKIAFEDLGCDSENSVDYPDYAGLVASRVSRGEADRGILVCGTGVGMAIAANKFSGVRAAALTDPFSARMAREHNDLNVLCLGGRVMGPGPAKELVEIFLNTPFAGGRHEARISKIKKLEQKNCK